MDSDFLWSPVIVTVYDRFEHFKSCVNSLLENEGADKTILYVSSDGPKSSDDERVVTQIRKAAAKITGFKKVIVFSPEENTHGKIQKQLVDHVRRKHSSYIFLEDDVYCSPGFLSFMNQGLEDFKDNFDIEAICGYLYEKIPSCDGTQIYLKSFTPWGYGTWSSRESFYSGEKDSASKIFADRAVFNEVNRSLPHTVRLSREVLRGRLEALDVNVCNRLFTKNKFCVYPSFSLTRNMGFDGSGENCRVDSSYARQVLGTSVPTIDPIKPVEEDRVVRRFLFYYFGGYVVSFLNQLLYLEYRISPGVGRGIFSWFNDFVWAILSKGYGLYRNVRESIFVGHK